MGLVLKSEEEEYVIYEVPVFMVKLVPVSAKVYSVASDSSVVDDILEPVPLA